MPPSGRYTWRMNHTVIPVTPYRQNCSLIWCEATRRGALVDPGGEAEQLIATAARLDIHLEKLLLTHGHLDHVGAAGAISKQLGIPIEGPQIEDAFLLEALPEQSAMFGFPYTERFTPQRWLEHGDRVSVGETVLDVLHCPGHTPGHVVFFSPADRLAFVGDVLFHGSIGRTDFARGDYQTLVDSIRHRLWPLGDDVRFVPGHGAMSSFGEERRSNPFVGDDV